MEKAAVLVNGFKVVTILEVTAAGELDVTVGGDGLVYAGQVTDRGLEAAVVAAFAFPSSAPRNRMCYKIEIEKMRSL